MCLLKDWGLPGARLDPPVDKIFEKVQSKSENDHGGIFNNKIICIVNNMSIWIIEMTAEYFGWTWRP